jgi:hypothetical protein
MTRSIRRLVGAVIAALALGCFFAVVVAPQVAATANSHKIQSIQLTLSAGIQGHEGSVLAKTSTKAVVLKPKAAATATAACTSARQAFDAARAKDKAEDTPERASATSDPNFKTTDVAEDKAEMAAMKPLADAVRTACGFTKPTPSAQCTAALQTAKATFAADRTEDTAEKTAGTEGSAADVTEDKAEMAKLGTLWNSIRTACGFGSTTTGARPDFHFFGTTSWRH